MNPERHSRLYLSNLVLSEVQFGVTTMTSGVSTGFQARLDQGHISLGWRDVGVDPGQGMG